LNLKLKNKTALITGSSSGIGLAIAKKLSKEGCYVILNGRSEDKLKEASKKIPNSKYIVGDVEDYEHAGRIIESVSALFGKLDILVCNVGSGAYPPPGQENIIDWKNAFSKNFWSALNIIDTSKSLLEKSMGTIICISSICGHEDIDGAPMPYGVAKTALNRLIKSTAREFSKMNIRVNGVSPGNIMFKGSTWHNKLKKSPKKVNDMLQKEVPLKRFGTENEIGDLVVYLASPISSFVTGSIWIIDGGQLRSF
jgi:3-oxoacyl-[acyl-carrier protein] reductase